ncbi:GTP-binding protein 1 [Liparis tanakae]|uniref:GTP-binding protein 1 n=1 Tax=Liparis tanakae TaxID=230148 RepID=A0A4Z2DZ81_9TELE|nr:GTP-binding protein 1 [Liparis tanakae]
MNKDCLRTGDKAAVHFRFIKTPEYLHCDHKLVFREGRTKAVGTITKLLQAVNTQAAKAQQAKLLAGGKKSFREAAGGEEAGGAADATGTLPVSRHAPFIRRRGYGSIHSKKKNSKLKSLQK